MDRMMNMDDIDFWEVSDPYNCFSEENKVFNVTLRHSFGDRQPLNEISTLPSEEKMKQPLSNISTLPSEDEMDFEHYTNQYNNDLDIVPQQEEITGTSTVGQSENIDVAEYENIAPGETVALHNNREQFPPEQLKKNEAKKEKNRQSAKKSRDKKKEKMEELKKDNTALEEKNKALVLSVGGLRLGKELLELYVNKLSCCIQIQESDDDSFEETGVSSKVPWTKEDEEMVEYLDHFPCLTIKAPMIQQEANDSPSATVNYETKYTDLPEGYATNYDNIYVRGEYSVNASSVNDGSESNVLFSFSPEISQGSYLINN